VSRVGSAAQTRAMKQVSFIVYSLWWKKCLWLGTLYFQLILYCLFGI
jgi:hypothetical protein